MKKEFTMHSVKMTVTKLPDSDFYKVELQDKYGLRTVVYERTFLNACGYAREWEADTENRKKLHDIETKHIGEMIKIDEERSTRLSLD